MHIIPVASGKGGVGKSLISANLAIALAQNKQKVLVIDLDLGGSNLHHVLGIRGVPKGIGTLIVQQEKDIESIIIPTEYTNVDFISGDGEIPGMANIKTVQKNSLVGRFKKITGYDYLILDLGAGSHTNTLDFFLMSSKGIIVTTPNLTSVTNAYLFLKNVVFRLMAVSFKINTKAYNFLEVLKKQGTSLQQLYIPKLLERIEKIDPESYAIFYKVFEKLKPRVIFNLLEDPKDVDKANRVQISTKQYLGLDFEYLGVLYRDTMQDIALNSRLPVIIYKPKSVLAQGIYRIADKIIEYKDSDELYNGDATGALDLIINEAQEDYDSKMLYVQDLMKVGALGESDLLEMVKIQQIEISKIRRENILLKSKLKNAIAEGFKL